MRDIVPSYRDGVAVIHYPREIIGKDGLNQVITTIGSLPDDPTVVVLPSQAEVQTPLLRWFIDAICQFHKPIAIVWFPGMSRLGLDLVCQRTEITIHRDVKSAIECFAQSTATRES